ncbi:cold shock domain-containing protein [Streptomyces bambusae]|uniref:cold shock domain-containing protein n=1 Tax=Streptomyces bambusae TaxID=1550616 RepID=UPI001CFC80B7|nr:cold shock domain-containing protein [Streptomyces bambusae]MCB5167488.1 cold shock domain-containing protein [Streptomyces bambusae]
MAETTSEATGTLLWCAPSGSFAFVAPDDRDGPDLFVHCSDLAGDARGGGRPVEGEAVVYELGAGASGPWARNVRRRT